MPLRVGDVPSPEGEDSEAVYAFRSRCTLTDAVYPSCCKCVTEDGSSHTAALRTRGIDFCLPDWGEAQGSRTWAGEIHWAVGVGPGGGAQTSSRPITLLEPHPSKLCRGLLPQFCTEYQGKHPARGLAFGLPGECFLGFGAHSEFC